MPELNGIELITQRIKLKDLPVKDEVILVLKDEYGVGEAEQEVLLKGLNASDMKFDGDEMAIITTITTSTKDRDNEIVLPEGAILDQYEKTPVVLFGHDHHSLPIGRNEWIKADKKGLVAKTIYANTEEGIKIFNYRKEGNPLAQSIGFIPVEWVTPDKGSKEEKAGVRRIYTKWILLEYSDVPVPSNPDAIAIAINKALLKVEDAPEYIVIEDDMKILTEKLGEIKEPVVEEKSVDLKGNPSIWDINSAIQSILNPKTDMWTKWVADIYPMKYPNGHVIIAESDKGKDKYRQYDYTYSDSKAELSKESTELESGYKPKKDYKNDANIDRSTELINKTNERILENQKLLDQIIEIQNEKEGRTLSAKTRKAMTNAVTVIETAIGELSELLKATEKLEPLLPGTDDKKADEEYNCECIDCGWKTTTEKHCKDIKCEECGGTMRREERPGPGEDDKKYITFSDDVLPEKKEIDVDDIDKQVGDKINVAIKKILPDMLKNTVNEVLKAAKGKI